MRAALLLLALVAACDRNAELLPGDGGAISCTATSDCPSEMVCGKVDDAMQVCLVRCDPAGPSCRDGYDCCTDHTQPGSNVTACAPASSRFCGG